MTLSEFYSEVAKRADTDKTQISAAVTSRVLSEAFQVLCAMDATEMVKVVSQGLTKAKSKAAKSAGKS